MVLGELPQAATTVHYSLSLQILDMLTKVRESQLASVRLEVMVVGFLAHHSMDLDGSMGLAQVPVPGCHSPL